MPETEINCLERVTVRQAAKELAMDVTCLQYGLRNNEIPIGKALKRGKRYSYYVYRNLLDAYKKGGQAIAR